jgi:hypothetical protein
MTFDSPGSNARARAGIPSVTLWNTYYMDAATLMTNQESAIVFDRNMASSYDKGNAVFAPLREALNFLMRTILSELPIDAQILCVGVGTGSEVIVGVASPRRISPKPFRNGGSHW